MMDCSNIDPKLMKALLSEYAPVEVLVEFMDDDDVENSEQHPENNVGD